MFCARVAKIFTQDLQERLVGRERNVCLLAIQREPNLRCLLRFNWKCGHFFHLFCFLNDCNFFS